MTNRIARATSSSLNKIKNNIHPSTFKKTSGSKYINK